jgi:hypothetical protein
MDGCPQDLQNHMDGQFNEMNSRFSAIGEKFDGKA